MKEKKKEEKTEKKKRKGKKKTPKDGPQKLLRPCCVVHALETPKSFVESPSESVCGALGTGVTAEVPHCHGKDRADGTTRKVHYENQKRPLKNISCGLPLLLQRSTIREVSGPSSNHTATTVKL